MKSTRMGTPLTIRKQSACLHSDSEAMPVWWAGASREKLGATRWTMDGRDSFARGTAKERAMIDYVKNWVELKTGLRGLAEDRRAVTAMEYALMGSLIAVAIITAVSTLGTNIGHVFNTISNSL
jgi:pilus assembly protein Flp/PilA